MRKPEDIYPESERLFALRGIVAQQVELLEWLESEGFEIARYFEDELCPSHLTKKSLVYLYHNIDEKKLEQERQQMIEAMRKANSPKQNG